MTDTTKGLSADDVRALFSDHLEGTLEPALQQQVDEALANDPSLSAERRRFEQTVSLLRALPAPEAPANLVAQVRSRLAAERQQQPAQVIPLPTSRRWSTRGVELVAGLCAVAAVVAVVVIGVPGVRSPAQGQPEAGMLTAGGASSTSLSLSWRAPGLPRADVVAAALQAGLTEEADGSFAGDRQGAARFLVALKTQAATSGSDVSGTIPEQADRVVVVVVP